MRGSKKQKETVRDLYQLYGTGRDSKRQPVTMGDSKRHEAIRWDRRDSERQPATIGGRERHTATTWDQRDGERHVATP